MSCGLFYAYIIGDISTVLNKYDVDILIWVVVTFGNRFAIVERRLQTLR